jgi:hypothetical protein
MTRTMSIPDRPAAGKPKQSRTHMALKLGTVTPELRQQAAAVLEVLAGVRSPTDAARDLSLSLPAYYKLESRAVAGLILACRPPGRGPQPAPELEAHRLRKQCQRLQQDLSRYQALARSVQRAAGLPTPPKSAPTDAKGRRKRKPAVRALRALSALRQAPEAPAPPATPPAKAATATGPVAPDAATVQ